MSRLSGHIRVNHYNSMFYRMVVTKAVWAAWRIGVPLLLWQRVSPLEYWTLFLIAELASGYWLAINFQASGWWGGPGAATCVRSTSSPVEGEGAGGGWCAHPQGHHAPPTPPPRAQVSHLSTDLEFVERAPESAPAAATLPEPWAVTQVKTSLDYGHDNAAMTFLCGALNYQVPVWRGGGGGVEGGLCGALNYQVRQRQQQWQQ